jgi:hypothetical protein
VAYERRAEEACPDDGERAAFWSQKLSEPIENVRELLQDSVALRRLMRYRLMKHGGVGYAPPREGSFPMFDDVVHMTLDCGALPSGGWLDGTHDGEQDAQALFRLWKGKGVPVVTIVPDRNWNLEDAGQRAVKVANFHEAVGAAERLEMPILVGTEMNAEGQKFVDTFDAPAMEPHRQAFLDGAHFAWGHTLLKTTAAVGAVDEWARAQFGGDAAGRNAFFRRAGAAPYPGEAARRELAAHGRKLTPKGALEILEG